MRNLKEPRDNRDERPVPVAVPSRPEFQNDDESHSLMPKDQVEEMRARWNSIQGAFVDEPRRAVEDADALVASAIERISQTFTGQRADLEKQWSQGEEASTESLRLALQQYRAFFSRLLSV